MAGLSSKNLALKVFTVIYFLFLFSSTCKTDGATILGKDILAHSHLGRPDDFSIYCYRGEPKILTNTWKTVHFRVVNLSPDDYNLFPGVDEQDVQQRYEASFKSWFQLVPWHWETVRLPVFNYSCVGVHASRSYRVKLDIIRIDYWRVLLFASGLFLYHFSPSLTRNIFFHYSTGIFLGITSSLLLLIFIVSRFIPKKSGAAALLFGGWAIVLYVVQKLWYNVSTILQTYQNYVIAYVCISGIASFAICYRYGPVENPKTLNLIKWSLQSLGLALIYSSSDWQEISMAIVIIVLIAHNIPCSWTRACKTYWRRRFPPRIKLISEEEFNRQGSIETEKALNELRKFCQSPQCSPWKIVPRLASPLRFADFVEGTSHLSDEEILEYETSVTYKPDRSAESDSSNE